MDSSPLGVGEEGRRDGSEKGVRGFSTLQQERVSVERSTANTGKTDRELSDDEEIDRKE